MSDKNVLPPVDPNQRYSIDEACRYLRITRSTIYDRIADGDLKTIKDGGRTYIPGSEIIRRSTLPQD